MPPKLTTKKKITLTKLQGMKTIDEKVTGTKQRNSNIQAERIADENKQDPLTLNVNEHKIDQHVHKYGLNSSNSANKDKENVVNENKSTNSSSSNEKQESSSIVQKDNTTDSHPIFEADINFANNLNLIRNNEKRKRNLYINKSLANSTVNRENVGLNVKHKEGSTYTIAIVKEESFSSVSKLDLSSVGYDYPTYNRSNVTDLNTSRKTAMSKSNVDNKNNLIGTLCNDKNEESITNDTNNPIDTVTAWTDRQAESHVSNNNTSNASSPLKRKYTAGNKPIQSNGNPVLETQQGVSNGKQISSDKINVVANTKPSTSGIGKARVISKQKSESKKLEISETILNPKTDHKTEPNTYEYKSRQRNANNNKSYVEVNDDNGDFSDSSASWAPSECDSDSDSQAKIKKMKMTPMKQYTNSNKDIRARPVVPQMKAPDISLSTANKNLPIVLQNDILNTANKNLPIVLQNDILNRRNDFKAKNYEVYESFKTAMCYLKTESNSNINKFQEIKNILNTMRGHKKKSDLKGFRKPIEVSKKCGNSSTIKDDKGENVPSDGSSKSDDHNVLITNKYRNIKEIEKTSNERKELKRTKCENINGSQMVALGNGTTLIHRAIYDKINWTSYAKATRGLLRAVFPRSVLATHSLTGKPSPAFRNKQAKMCLDRKKVLDILNEVRDKFLVQENCVRGVITTTCADESKMRRTRQIKKKENVPPTKKDSVNKPNTES